MELYSKTENSLFDNFISFGIATDISKKKKKKFRLLIKISSVSIF